MAPSHLFVCNGLVQAPSTHNLMSPNDSSLLHLDAPTNLSQIKNTEDYFVWPFLDPTSKQVLPNKTFTVAAWVMTRLWEGEDMKINDETQGDKMEKQRDESVWGGVVGL